MTDNDAERMLELEEAAEGIDLYRAPGSALQQEKAEDQAEASGWIPESNEPAAAGHPKIRRARRRRVELRQAMFQLETAIARAISAPGWIDSVDSSVRYLRDALEAHVEEVEGLDGLLAEIVRVAPRLASATKEMEKQHRELLASVDRVEHRLVEKIETGETELRTTVLALLRGLTMHRQHGADLVYEAYNLDIAASD